MEDNKDVQVEQTEVTTQAEQVEVKEPVNTSYKVFDTEDDYNREMKSTSSKAKYEMLKELGAKNLDEVRGKFTELEAVKSELANLDSIRSELETTKLEKQKVSEDLIVTKLGVKEESRDDFLVLAKNKLGDFDNSLEDAAKSILDKYTYFSNSDVIAQTKIGVEKKTKSVSTRNEIMDLTKL